MVGPPLLSRAPRDILEGSQKHTHSSAHTEHLSLTVSIVNVQETQGQL